jgi:hypothetical protein
MSKAFAPKPIVGERPSGTEIRDLVAPALRGVAVQAPAQGARWQDDDRPEGEGVAPTKAKAVRTMQINFRVSEDFARLIAQEAEKMGGMRRWFAHLARQNGYEVPAIDLNPPTSRREW